MQTKLYIGTNTKMYKTIADTDSFVSTLAALTADISPELMELFVIPSYTAVAKAKECASGSFIKVGAQNMCWEDEGQFTGEISPGMLSEVGAEIIELGHSERRHVMMETDDMIRKKVNCSVRHGFTTLLCIGETGEQKRSGKAEKTLRDQLEEDLRDIEFPEKLWVAYEPVWAIGVNGEPATPEYAERMHGVIREALIERFGDNAMKVPLLYGGSVNNENSVPFILRDNIDGLFIGRSAWNAENFNKIIRDVLSALQR